MASLAVFGHFSSPAWSGADAGAAPEFGRRKVASYPRTEASPYLRPIWDVRYVSVRVTGCHFNGLVIDQHNTIVRSVVASADATEARTVGCRVFLRTFSRLRAPDLRKNADEPRLGPNGTWRAPGGLLPSQVGRSVVQTNGALTRNHVLDTVASPGSMRRVDIGASEHAR